MAEKPKIIAADIVEGDLLVTFRDETTVLFRAAFLSEVRDEDGNRQIEDTLPDDLSN